MSSGILAPRDYQLDALADFRRRVLAGDTRIPSVLATGLGKGHPLDTEVPTSQGWRRWGDLEVGDEVFGRDGSSTCVLEVYDRGVLETYRVTFSDGSSALVDGDHLWTVRDSGQSYRPWGTIETRTLAGLELKCSRGWRFHVPMTAPLERAAADLPLDPYVVGALISNGSMVGTGTQLTTPDTDVAIRVGAAVECRKIKDTTEGVCDRYSLPGLQGITRALGMRVHSREKRIPAVYLEGSLEQRTALLHGLMDGDGGGRDASRRSVGYFTSSEQLARDVSELVTSLGGTGIVKRYDRGAKGVEYAVRILLPSSVSAFSTPRKGGAGTSSVRNLQPKRAIVSVVLEGEAPIRCIRVAAADSLYLITRQHIVTHNTVIFAHLASQWEELRQLVDSRPGKRILVLAHTDELVLQAARKVQSIAPHLSVGIVKAERNEVSASVVVASVQSLRSEKRRAQLRNVGLIIVDECHHAVAGTYRKILEHFGAFDVKPACIVAGFTATLARGDKLKLSEVWEDCTFKRGISFGIRRGYLLDVRGKRIVVPDMDLSKVKKSGGDFQDSSLAEELDRTFAPEIVAAAYREHAADRKGIVFVPTVESAHHFAEAFVSEGIPAAVVHGKLAREERRLILKKLSTGEVQVVINCAVLTEGFDDPTISCIVIARPTRSAPLFQQMVGRGLRPDLSLSPDDRCDCLVLDVVGASRTHDLRSLVDLSEADIREELDEGPLSLLEMEEEEERLREIEGAEPQEVYLGETETREFDPLGRTTIGAWNQTYGGTYFVPAGSGRETEIYVLLVPSEEPGLWDVAWLTENSLLFAHTECLPSKWQVTKGNLHPYMVGLKYQEGCGAPGATTEHTGVSLEAGISWAEEVMENFGASYGSKKSASWRRGEPTQAQLGYARRLGIDLPEGITKGEAGDLITVAKGSARIDPVVQFMIKMRDGA